MLLFRVIDYLITKHMIHEYAIFLKKSCTGIGFRLIPNRASPELHYPILLMTLEYIGGFKRSIDPVIYMWDVEWAD
ncbi:hypothetical protein ACJX0J_023727, partial [Zea mays]